MENKVENDRSDKGSDTPSKDNQTLTSPTIIINNDNKKSNTTSNHYNQPIHTHKSQYKHKQPT